MSSADLLRAYPRAPLKTLFALALCALAATIGSPGARAEAPTAFMQRVANELVEASRVGSTAMFAAAIRSYADVPAIGLSALGDYAASLPKTERPTYFNGMINFIARYAAKEAPNYPVAKAIVVGQSQETVGGTLVDSRVMLKSGETYDVRWRLVRREGGYKVREAEVIGFQMTTFLNTLFQNYISENGGNPRTLVLALNR
jgi:phospholipid transport system substrate-binding protein